MTCILDLCSLENDSSLNTMSFMTILLLQGHVKKWRREWYLLVNRDLLSPSMTLWQVHLTHFLGMAGFYCKWIQACLSLSLTSLLKLFFQIMNCSLSGLFTISIEITLAHMVLWTRVHNQKFARWWLFGNCCLGWKTVFQCLLSCLIMHARKSGRAPTSAQWRMDGMWTGDNFSSYSSPIG